MSPLTDSSIRYPHPQVEIDKTQRRQWILQFAPKEAVGAEIGVFRGHFSEVICSILKPKELYLVDPWESMGEFFGWSSEYTAHNQLPTRVAREETQERVSKFPDVKSKLIIGKFPEDKHLLPDSIDWFYLDASHKYERTKWELEEAAKMLAPGGVIMGDDWHAQPTHQHHGVYLAVNEFVSQSNFSIIASGKENQWCIKRKEELEEEKN